MRLRWKRWSVFLLGLSLIVLILFLPGLPWSGRIRHTLRRTIVKSEIKLAKWRGLEPRLVSIAGHVNAPGAQIQVLDSRSGWATIADRDGKFVLPDEMWYPAAKYDLVISKNESAGRLFEVQAPKEYPGGGVFSIGELDADEGSSVEIKSLIGDNSITLEDFDASNSAYYKSWFEKLTEGKQNDKEKISAINDYVAGKLNYDETQWELGSPRRVLERGSQYCGHLSTALQTLLAIGGYRTRAVHMSNGAIPPGTHAVVEVFYDGGWHLYDPTFGLEFQQNKDGRVASYRDVRLDTSMLKEDLFVRFKPEDRRKWMALLPGIYQTGYHHYYYLKNK